MTYCHTLPRDKTRVDDCGIDVSPTQPMISGDGELAHGEITGAAITHYLFYGDITGTTTEIKYDT